MAASTPGPVRELPPEVARKIAAGEVIDRPGAIVRELLDNAVDAGAENIIVEIEEGGVKKVRVADDGAGMTREDIEHCARPHATSKISQDADLLNISTLGFRGEALASIAAVSRLTITSARDGAAWRLCASVAGGHSVERANLSQGTIAQSEDLFEDVPARRHFLKRAASEGAVCRQVFVEKAIPRPDIAFQFISEGALKLDLPAGQTPQERLVDALQAQIDPRFLFQTQGADPAGAWRFSLILGDPEVFRQDRKFILIYVNGRKIAEFALIQAIEYGASGFFPNGAHPVAALFLEVDPSLVDFNIHPAKKEARFKDIAPIHRSISGAVRQFFHHAAVRGALNPIGPSRASVHETGADPLFPAREGAPESRGFFYQDSFLRGELPHAPAFQPQGPVPPADFPVPPAPGASQSPGSFRRDRDFRYLGTAFGVFIIVERGETLFLIDHHAAHERILYDQFIASQGQRQTLLIPYVIETANRDEDDYLESLKTALFDAGFEMTNCGSGRWEAATAPVLWNGGEEDLREALLQKRLNPEEVLARCAAACACKQAVKEGDVLGAETACFIAEQTLAMENPRCPHGRPLYAALPRDDLYRAVKRT